LRSRFLIWIRKIQAADSHKQKMADGHRFEGVDWDAVIDQLMAEALRLFASARMVGEERVLKGLGQSPEDLVYGTVEKVLEDKTVQYRKSRGPLVPFLKQVMRHDFIDLLRKKAYKTTTIIDPEDDARHDADGEVITLDSFEGKREQMPDVVWRMRVRELASDDQMLLDYVDAILECGLTKPSDIAQLLSTTVADILNRRRRLATRIARIPELTRL
jgi:hypothetical protein